MDGGGRLDQSLMGSGLLEVGEAGAPHDAPALSRVSAAPRRRRLSRPAWGSAYRSFAIRWRARLMWLPSGSGIAASILLVAAALGYGVVKGQHVPDVTAWFKDARD